MNKVALVVWREYMENVRTKGFWIGILSLPLIFALSATVPFLLTKAKDARTYAVLDHSGFVLAEVEKKILELTQLKLSRWQQEDAQLRSAQPLPFRWGPTVVSAT